jgi:hypothetical protein
MTRLMVCIIPILLASLAFVPDTSACGRRRRCYGSEYVCCPRGVSSAAMVRNRGDFPIQLYVYSIACQKPSKNAGPNFFPPGQENVDIKYTGGTVIHNVGVSNGMAAGVLVTPNFLVFDYSIAKNQPMFWTVHLRVNTGTSIEPNLGDIKLKAVREGDTVDSVHITWIPEQSNFVNMTDGASTFFLSGENSQYTVHLEAMVNGQEVEIPNPERKAPLRR